MRNLLDRHEIGRLARRPQAADFRPRTTPSPHGGASLCDEVLIVDARASLRPAQLVERKLMSLLKSVYLPVSHVRTTALANGRSPLPVASSQSERRSSGAAGVRVIEAESETTGQAVASVCCLS